MDRVSKDGAVMKQIAKRDWTLLAICAADGQALSPVQLQKVLFLLGQKLPKEVGGDFYSFKPYDYGPFDASIYTDADLLAKDGLVAIQTYPGQRWVEYAATTAGMERAEGLKKLANQAATRYLQEVVKWARGLTFQQLVRAIYAEYPKFAVRSVFKG